MSNKTVIWQAIEEVQKAENLGLKSIDTNTIKALLASFLFREKQQIVEAFNQNGGPYDPRTGDEYYSETFKNE